MLGWGPPSVDMCSTILVRPSFVTVVSVLLAKPINVQVVTARLAHYSYRIHIGFLHGRGQGRPLFILKGSGWYMQYHQWSVKYYFYIKIFVGACGPWSMALRIWVVVRSYDMKCVVLQAPTAGTYSWKHSYGRDNDPGGPNVYSKRMYYITDQEQH